MTTPTAGTDPNAAYNALYDASIGVDGVPRRYERMRREHGAVAPVTIAPGLGAWLVIGHPELLRVTRDEQDFSHDPRRWNLLREGRVPADSPVMPMVMYRPALLYFDGQQHRRTRSAVAAALARIDGHELRRTVRAAAERLIGGFATAGEADLVTGYAQRLPLEVIMGLLGLDEATGQELVRALAGTVRADAGSAAASRRMAEILMAHIVDRRRHPQHDLTSALLEHPAALSDEEVLHNMAVIFVAGNQTTTNWIATTLRILLCDPDFRSSVTAGRLSVDDALDRVLWHFPPTQNFPARYATRDLTLGGQHIRAGDMLVLGLAAANADPRVLPEDGVPVIGNRSHLAFGAGPHQCPAQDPARLITRTAVDTVRRLLPDLELAVPEPDLEWVVAPWSWGLAGLPVRFTAPTRHPEPTAVPGPTGPVRPRRP
ncbi:cytochrome P450 [Streptomyces odontomachi]|uniref:cytochrome P450 n=1 Tax=Streptomyces odontomachi TaxID=2944940 RepID=UPI00210ED89D|nr:cytochrome P450 [Streptomyces sp. ODS25]